MVKSESVVFNGHKYNRYPESKHTSHQRYFQRSGGDSYHRAIWRYYNGPIPDGCDIHHKDGDWNNNDISNLECLPKHEHYKKHQQYTSQFNKRSDQLDHLESIRGKAAEWHKSDEGREWHRQVSAKALVSGGPAQTALAKKRTEQASNPFIKVCVECGSEFSTPTGRATLCGNACACRRSGRNKRERKRLQSEC